MALLQIAEPSALFLDQRYIEDLRPLLAAIPTLRLSILFDGEDNGCTPYEELLAGGEDIEPDIRVGDDDIVGRAFTSGTTGRPKGVLQSQRMIKNLVTAITLDYEIQPDEFRYSSSPMFHIGGQSPVLMHAWRGFPTLILPQFEVDPVLRWMQEGGLTGCFLVPTMISSLLGHPEADKSTYTQLRSIIYGRGADATHRAPPRPRGLSVRLRQRIRRRYRNRTSDSSGIGRSSARRRGNRASSRLHRQTGVRSRPPATRRGRERGSSRNGRRDRHPQCPDDVRLPEPTRRNGEGTPGRLVSSRRPRPHGRRRLPLPRWAAQRHDHPRRREHLPN